MVYVGDPQEYGLCASFFFQAEDGIRDLVRSRGLGDVYKRQAEASPRAHQQVELGAAVRPPEKSGAIAAHAQDLLLSLIHI